MHEDTTAGTPAEHFVHARDVADMDTRISLQSTVITPFSCESLVKFSRLKALKLSTPIGNDVTERCFEENKC